MIPTSTLPGRLLQLGSERPDEISMLWRRFGCLQELTWQAVREYVLKLRRGLSRLGVQPGDRVVVWCDNCVEWLLSDLAILTTGAVSVPVYAADGGRDARFILSETAATTGIFGVEQWRRLNQDCEAPDKSAPQLSLVIVIHPGESIEALRSGHARNDTDPVPSAISRRIAWEALAATNEEEELDDEQPGVPPGPDDLATIIFTSGTSGDPRGVMFDHKGLLAAGEAVLAMHDVPQRYRTLSYLPLSHAIERLNSVILPVLSGGAVAVAGAVDEVPGLMREVRPDLFIGVPRVWEKTEESIRSRVAAGPRWKRWLFQRSIAIGQARAATMPHTRPNLWLRIQHRLIDALVLHRLRRELGMDRARYLLSGGAPLNQTTLAFFESLGLDILEDYGQTETIVTTVSTPDRRRSGSVGVPLHDTQVRIADDGEIEIRSQHLFAGYWKRELRTTSGKFSTAPDLTEDGWFPTGDLGRLSSDGLLTITGRKKSLIITSGGKNIAPEPLEQELETIPFVQRAVVVGDGRRHLAALLFVPNPEPVRATARNWKAGNGRAELSLAGSETLHRHISRLNAGRSSFEQIKACAVLEASISVESGELTPLGKIRRGIIEDRFSAEIESLYATADRHRVSPGSQRPQVFATWFQESELQLSP